MTSPKNKQRQGHRSLFLPIILIGVGCIWLLANLGIISGEQLSVLGRIWPLFLIIVGIELLVGSKSRHLGTVIGLASVGLVILLLLLGPSLGLSGNWNFNIGFWETVGDEAIQTEQFSEAIDDATSASVTFDLSFENLNIGALIDSNDLIEADIEYIGEMNFDVSGDTHKQIRLTENNLGRSYHGSRNLEWNVGLSSEVELELAFDVSSGEVHADLTDLQLSALDIELSSGDINIQTPNDASFDFRKVDVSSGNLTMVIGENTAFDVKVDVSSGSVTFDVADNAAVQVNATSISSGNVNIPDSYQRISGDDGKEGIWESPSYSGSDAQIMIRIDLSSGNVTVK